MIYLTATETLGARLRRLRLARGWSQLELSAQAEVSQVEISYWERDLRHPHPRNLNRLAAAWGCTLMELLT